MSERGYAACELMCGSLHGPIHDQQNRRRRLAAAGGMNPGAMKKYTAPMDG
jgi:hypothetical protein